MKSFLKRKSRRTKTEKQNWQKLLFAVIIGLGVSFILMGLFAAVYNSADIPLSTTNLFSSAALIAGGLLCGFVYSRQQKEKGMKNGVVAGFAFFCFFFPVSLCFGNKIGMQLLVKCAIIIAASVLGGIYGVNYRKKRIKNL